MKKRTIARLVLAFQLFYAITGFAGQATYTIPDEPGRAFRLDINSTFQAAQTNNSGATAPSVTFPFQFWADTGTDTLWQRNAANTGWIGLFTLSTGAPIVGGGSAASGLTGTTLAGNVINSSLLTAAGGTFNTGAFAPAYSLPTASTSTLGGVKVDGSTVTISNGVISANVPASGVAGVASYNGRAGTVVSQSSDVTGALGFTPYNSTNPSNYIAAASAPVQSVNGRTGAITIGSGDIPNNAANTTGLAGGISGVSTLPNGTMAITQASSDATTKIATDAFVAAVINGAINPSSINTTGSIASSGTVDGTTKLTYVNGTTCPSLICAATTAMSQIYLIENSASGVGPASAVTINLPATSSSGAKQVFVMGGKGWSGVATITPQSGDIITAAGVAGSPSSSVATSGTLGQSVSLISTAGSPSSGWVETIVPTSGGSGTVTAVSGVGGNGLIVTVSNAATTPFITVSGVPATATALAATPAQCSGGQFATGITANGTSNCGTPAGGGNISASGTPTTGTIAVFGSSSTIQGTLGVGTANGASTVVQRDASGIIAVSGVTASSINLSMGADGTAVGPKTSDYNAGYTTTLGDLVYLDSSGTWQKANATTATTSGPVRLGIALQGSITSGNPLSVARSGSMVYMSAAFPTLTVGAPVYVSTTAGAITQTPPSSLDNVIRIIGYAVHADKIEFEPSALYVTYQ